MPVVILEKVTLNYEREDDGDAVHALDHKIHALSKALLDAHWERRMLTEDQSNGA